MYLCLEHVCINDPYRYDGMNDGNDGMFHSCSTTFRNLGDGSNHQMAPRFQERIQPHWDRTLFSLITTSRHLKDDLEEDQTNYVQIIPNLQLQVDWSGINLEKKTTWMFFWGDHGDEDSEALSVFYTSFKRFAFLWIFNPVGFSISNHKIIKSLKSNGRNPNHISFLVVMNSDIIWMFV